MNLAFLKKSLTEIQIINEDQARSSRKEIATTSHDDKDGKTRGYVGLKRSKQNYRQISQCNLKR